MKNKYVIRKILGLFPQIFFYKPLKLNNTFVVLWIINAFLSIFLYVHLYLTVNAVVFNIFPLIFFYELCM